MAVNEKLGYSDETEALIQRQCRNVERKDFRLDKTAAAEAILKTYDLFGLTRPKHIVWCKDIFENDFGEAAGTARAARAAGTARAAWTAGAAGTAWTAGAARAARAAWTAWTARAAGTARAARAAWTARAARAAGTALDYDFDYYTLEYEYCQNPYSDMLPNKNDRIYLKYCELLMVAKEYGAGYRIERKDTLYIVPTPLVRTDTQNRFHSEDSPAIRWKGGKKFYFLRGESFSKPLWRKIVDKTITADEVMRIADSDKRAIAISMLKPEEMLKQLKAELIDTGAEGTKLYACKNFMGTRKIEYCMFMKDWSTDRTFIEFVPPAIGSKGSAVLCQAAAYGIPEDQYLAIKDRG